MIPQLIAEDLPFEDFCGHRATAPKHVRQFGSLMFLSTWPIKTGLLLGPSGKKNSICDAKMVVSTLYCRSTATFELYTSVRMNITFPVLQCLTVRLNVSLMTKQPQLIKNASCPEDHAQHSNSNNEDHLDTLNCMVLTYNPGLSSTFARPMTNYRRTVLKLTVESLLITNLNHRAKLATTFDHDQILTTVAWLVSRIRTSYA